MTSPSEHPYSHVQAKHYRPGRAAVCDLIVVHCTAGPENTAGKGAEAVQAMFARGDRVASAHVTVDQNSAARSVHDWDTAYASKGFNARGLHLELVGMADQTRTQWLDPISRTTMLQGAKVVADWINRSNGRIRPVVMTVEQLKADLGGGVTFHADCDKAKASTGHWDPGPHFPRDVFIDMVKTILGNSSKPGARTNPYARYVEDTDLVYRGLTGGPVRFVQWATGLPIDGVWGSQAESLVRQLQAKHKRPITGRVEGWTLAYLREITR